MLFDRLRTVADELPGCRLTSIVSFETGLSLASVADGAEEEAAGADAFHNEMYRQIATALRELESSQAIENLVVQGRKAIFVSTPLGDSGYFWHVATDASTTLGYTQAVMRKWRDEIENSVDAFLAV